ncbi:Serine/threonine-protein phosphatase rdgC, partial [Gryllus bimaculatus]
AEEPPDIPEELQSPVEPSYKGAHLGSPLTRDDLDRLLDSFRRKKPVRLHARYVASVLRDAAAHLRTLPNLNEASTAHARHVTVCGDLHGHLDDLLVIFHKNGLPSAENPYVFNGDFVDRGRHGMEVFLLLLACLLALPGGVFLNRGNHEDLVMNMRYGFVREVRLKYKVFDVLWSDPQPGAGCVPNKLRGAGVCFGPDVSEAFLRRHGLQLLLRSHECKPLGFELAHGGKVMTVFSASDYYELGSNKGAYATLAPGEAAPHFVQFQAGAARARHLTFRQRVDLVEAAALRELRAQVAARRAALEDAFRKRDPDGA